MMNKSRNRPVKRNNNKSSPSNAYMLTLILMSFIMISTVVYIITIMPNDSANGPWTNSVLSKSGVIDTRTLSQKLLGK
jgi:hypothetical protein